MEKSLSKRSIAAFLDYTIFLILLIAYTYTFGKQTNTGGYTVNGFKTIPILLIWFCYFPLIELLTSASLFKYIFGLRVVKLNNNKLRLRDTALRHIFDMIDVYILFGLIGFLLIKINTLPQRLGDMLAKTVVVESADAELYTLGENQFQISNKLNKKYKSMITLPENIFCANCFSIIDLNENEMKAKKIECPVCYFDLDFNEK